MTTTYSPTSGTNLGPLTTTFTPSSGCDVAIVECETSCALGFRGQRCVAGIGGAGCRDNKSSCWPRAIVTNTDIQLNGWGYYSPGLQCPVGYESACTATASGSSGWSQQFSMGPDETAVGCCPSGFGCSLVNGIQSCYSYASSGAAVQVATCKRGYTQRLSLLTPSDGPRTFADATTTAVVGAMPTFTVQAPLIEIRWRSEDLPSATNSASTSTTPSSTSSPSDSDSSSGLSTGAKAAIGVVIPVVVLAILAAASFIWRHRKKKSRAQTFPAELDSNQRDVNGGAAPLTDKKPAGLASPPPLQEMESNERKAELGTEQPRYELEDNRPVSRGE